MFDLQLLKIVFTFNYVELCSLLILALFHVHLTYSIWSFINIFISCLLLLFSIAQNLLNWFFLLLLIHFTIKIVLCCCFILFNVS